MLLVTSPATYAQSIAAAAEQARVDGAAMASTVIAKWPNGVLATQARPGVWTYETGVTLDGMAAQWQVSANGGDFAYVKAAVDRWVDDKGNISVDPGKAFDPSAHTLDNLEPGRAVMLVYRVTGDARYAKAAKTLYQQFATQPRTTEGGFWHKQIYPRQMWLDGAYMAEPFRAAYAHTFQQTADFDDIAKQLLLMRDKTRDPKTGLLHHGWDASTAAEQPQPWADKQTGMSAEVWARAMGWYVVALVDTLPWFPEGHPDRPKLIAALQDAMAAATKYQDKSTGLWWDVLDKGTQPGNFLEASASEMFVYATAKGVRLGYLPQSYEASAVRGWTGIEKKFITKDAAGQVTLHGTVKVSGLGGKPYRAGDYNYYVHEGVGDDDGKGVGMYLMAASEMQMAATQSLAQGRLVLADAWFDSQTRKNAEGQTELFHYKFDDDANSGFAFFGRGFERNGARIANLHAAPTTENLAKASVYILASPDIPSKTPNPNYMDAKSGDAIEAWVKQGGVLLLMQNDNTNAEFEHFDTLTRRFGIHFNPVLRNTVEGRHFEQGELHIPAGTGGIFPQPLQVYMKEICTITTSGPAKPIYVDRGDTLMAVARVGKGTVYAVVDPWLYNEYVDGRKLPKEFQNFDASVALSAWALRQTK
ncbi:unsaturated rhamnogalacturonyl hydrolase [Terriglobus roseus]|uniref:Unsaturated rhamnogalacturonyl hydrolase n=1 Tax=Terriglobus roseus TaxID=392734 RepID=A0A1H4TD40_9BACT|nr:unsaturated rhamnogalacturonyl hydrolase [Terriglobus roseus]